MRQCYNCGWEWRKPQQPAFREMCPRCESFLHCCKNCQLYDPLSRDCKSPTTEKMGEEERSNFCEEFRFTEVEPPPKAKPRSKSRKRNSFNGNDNSSLNGAKGNGGGRMDPREKFRRLFKDD